jgi:hypothetical protein
MLRCTAHIALTQFGKKMVFSVILNIFSSIRIVTIQMFVFVSFDNFSISIIETKLGHRDPTADSGIHFG